MLLYNANDMKRFIDSSCEEIISFVIGPIHKKYYEAICYTMDNKYWLLYSENNIEKILEFVKTYCSNSRTLEEIHTKTSKEPWFIEKYKKEFMTEIDISFLKEQILLIKSFNNNGKQVKNCGVLDGFSMDCKIFHINETIHIKDYSYSKDYQAIIELANRILENIGVENDNRFIIVKR